MTRDKFYVVGDSLIGHGLSLSIAAIGPSDTDFGARLITVAEVIYRQGRESALLSRDDRFDLHFAVEGLRALGVILGPSPTGDRYRRCSDILARLIQDQDGCP